MISIDALASRSLALCGAVADRGLASTSIHLETEWGLDGPELKFGIVTTELTTARGQHATEDLQRTIQSMNFWNFT
jgi:hypothetical protein